MHHKSQSRCLLFSEIQLELFQKDLGWANAIARMHHRRGKEKKRTNIHIRGLFSSFRNIRVDCRFDLQFVLHKCQMLQMTAGHSHPSLTCFVFYMIFM